MKKMISIIFIILLVPFLVFSQEAAPTEKPTEKPVEKVEQEAAEPESFFNDLISSLNTGKEENKKEEPATNEGLPSPDPVPVPEEKAEPVDPDKISTDKTEVPVPDQAVPNSGINLDNQETVLPVDPLENNPTLPIDPLEKGNNELPVDPLEKSEEVPAPVQQIVPDNVPTQDIAIGPKAGAKEKKVKKERVKKEFVPFIEPPEAKSKAQKKYLKKMEKLPKSRMRLITFDQADIAFSRKFRSPEQALHNPANLGIRSEYGSSFSIIPFNTLDLNLNTSTRPFVFIDEFLSSGEVMTDAREDSMIAMLGPDGLKLPIDINMPTVLNLKMSLLGGSLFANAGLFVQERSTIPGEFFNILFDGATVDEPFQMTDELGIDLTAYAKGSAGYGTFVELPGVLGEIRFGATVNAYTGAFASVNITNLELVPSTEGVSLQGTLEAMGPLDTLSLFGPEGFQVSPVNDLMGIPGISMGYDFGLAWRFKLNRLLPIAPKFLKNYFDFQIGVEDLAASITMNHAYLREINFAMDVDPLSISGLNFSNIGDAYNLDSMMVLSETVLSSDSTISQPLGAKLNMALNYQPIPQLMLKGGITTYLSEGLNSNSGQNYFYGVDIFPVSSLCIHGSVTQKGNYRFSEAGIKLYSDKTEFGIKLRVYDLDFSLTENLSGAGLQLNWARYF